MDFHSLARRDLQTLCKKNKIPANLTNAAMADALQSLKSIEWDEVIQQKLMPQSKTIEHGSPLPRSRRVSARSSDISGFSVGEINDKEDEMTKEALIEANQTPATAVRRSQRIQSARTSSGTTAAAGSGTSMVGTRTKKGKKEEAPAEAVDVVVVETPAPQRGRKKAVETPAQGVVARSSARPTRQSTRRMAESTKATRVTRTMTNMMTLDIDDDKEAETVVVPVAEKVEAKKEETAVELKEVLAIRKTTPEHNSDTEGKETIISDTAPEQEQETRTVSSADVIELGETTEPKSADKLEIEEEADQNLASLSCDDLKDDPDEKLVEEVTEIGSDREAALISGEGQVAPEKDESEVNQTTLVDSPKMGLVSEVMTENNSDLQDAPSFDITLDELKDDVSDEKLVEEGTEIGSDRGAMLISEEGQVAPEKDESEVNQITLADSLKMGLVSEVMPENNSDDLQAALISEEGQVAQEKDESEVNQTLADSPKMGLVSEVMPENNSDLQDAPSFDAQDVPSGLCVSSPVRAPDDKGVEKMLRSVVGVEKMLESAVRHLALARLSCDAENIDASVVQKEETDKVVSDDAPELVQNENADKERVNLKSMSLRKLKSLYKDRLNELNSKKVVVEDGKRLPLGKLDENLLA